MTSNPDQQARWLLANGATREACEQVIKQHYPNADVTRTVDAAWRWKQQLDKKRKASHGRLA